MTECLWASSSEVKKKVSGGKNSRNVRYLEVEIISQKEANLVFAYLSPSVTSGCLSEPVSRFLLQASVTSL